MGVKKCFYIFFKILFSISLILIATKGFLIIESNKGYASQNIIIISEKILHNKSLFKYRKYCAQILKAEYILWILASIYSFFGLKIGKLFAFIACLIELIFVHNPLIYAEPYNRTFASYFVGLLFGILMN